VHGRGLGCCFAEPAEAQALHQLRHRD
jgi:hypothetical protein